MPQLQNLVGRVGVLPIFLYIFIIFLESGRPSFLRATRGERKGTIMLINGRNGGEIALVSRAGILPYLLRFLKSLRQR